MKALLAIIAIVGMVACAGCIRPPIEPEVVNIDEAISAARAEGYSQGRADEHAEAVKILQGYDLLLKKPTYDEVKAFMQEDGTDQMMVANCMTRVERLNNEAIKRGIWCYVVLFNYYTGSSYGFHALVAFDTVDKGLVFIETQTDDEVKCDIGIDYSEEMCRSGKICPLNRMIIKQIGVIR